MLLNLASLMAVVLIAAEAGTAVPSDDTTQLLAMRDDDVVRYNDPRLSFIGRWRETETEGMQADWPCTSIRFGVETHESDTQLTLLWSAVRVHINVSVWNESGEDLVSSEVYESSAIKENTISSAVLFSVPGKYVVIVRKLTCAASYGMGIGSKILKESKVSFYGIQVDRGLEILPVPSKKRRIEFIGASDTQGYCVDGSADMDNTLDIYLEGYKYDNCELAYPGLLSAGLDADYHIEAIAGIGLTQNAGANHPAEMGRLPMPDLFNRTIQLQREPTWDFNLYHPDLLMISLGGNDYNHQDGNVPSNETFSAAMTDFYLTLFRNYEQNRDRRA